MCLICPLQCVIGMLAVMLCLFGVALADSTEKEEIVRRDRFEITSEKTVETYRIGDVDFEQTPVFYSVITRAEFEGGIDDLSAVIEKEAGVQVRRSGGLGGYSSLSLRGSTSTQVMIYMDGILLNDASGGGVNLGNISLEDVEAIEIYRGAAPIRFGMAGIGGVVNIRTRRAASDRAAHAGMGYGSFGARQASVFVNDAPGKWDYLISADYLGAENDFRFLHDNRTPLNPDDDRESTRHNADFDQGNFLVKTGYGLHDDLRIDLLNQWFSKDQGIPSRWNFPDTRTRLKTNRNISAIQLSLNDIAESGINAVSTIHHSWKRETYDNPHYDHVGLDRQKNRYTTRRAGADLYLERIADRHELVLMLNAYDERYAPEDLLGLQNPLDSRRRSIAAGLQDSLYLLNGALILTPAVRRTMNHDELKSAVSVSGLPLNAQNRSRSDWSPQIGLKASLPGDVTLRSNLVKSIRYPSFAELFGDRGHFLGNNDLKKETSIHLDAGGEFERNVATVFLDRVVIGLAYFQVDVKDKISSIYDSRGVGRYINSGEAEIRGVEAAVKINFTHSIGLYANAAWTDAKIVKSSFPAFVGKRADGIYKDTYLCRMEIGDRIKAYAEYIVGRNIHWNPANSLKGENQEEVNAGVRWPIHGFDISLEGRNLLDDRYEEMYAYPLPGRAYAVKVTYVF